MEVGEVLLVVPIPPNIEQRGRSDPKLAKLLKEYDWRKVMGGYPIPPGFKAVVSHVSGNLRFILVDHPTGRRFLEISLFGDPDKDYTQIVWEE